MDGVVIYFGDALLSTVCLELDAIRGEVDGHPTFFVFPYEGEDWKNELDSGDVAKLVRILGRTPSCAVAIACRHGQAARGALIAVATVMSKFPNSVLDDDCNHLWSSAQVMEFKGTEPLDGLFEFYQAR
jgi:hypothetical protein